MPGSRWPSSRCARWFASERLDDPRLQTELAREVIERTAEALTVFTRPRVVH